jgi:nucleoside-diphosphate-sugar epimerase
MTTRILIGCGYLGSRLAKLWRATGDDVIATSRSGELSLEMLDSGVFPARADVTKPDTLKWLPVASALTGQLIDTLVYAVGYDRNSEPVIHTVYAQGLANVLAAMPDTVKRVIYISTTGVYGTAGGDWVDEQTPPDPQRDGGGNLWTRSRAVHRQTSQGRTARSAERRMAQSDSCR